MKNISSTQVAMSFTGIFLGAGFLSGQEIMQFFAAYGPVALISILLAVFFLTLFSYFILILVQKTDIAAFDAIIVPYPWKALRFFFGAVLLLFLFGVVVIMLAGSGILLQHLLQIPAWIGSILMAALIFFIACKGVQGPLQAFSLMVPLMLTVTVLVCLYHMVSQGLHFPPADHFHQANPLLGHWSSSMMAFVAYNMMAAISILIPIGREKIETNILRRGLFQGFLQLLLIAGAILIPTLIYFEELTQIEMPTQWLAGLIHPVVSWIFSLIFLMGMFASSLSCFYGVSFRLQQLFPFKVIRLQLLLMALALTGSFLGFKTLIAMLFPLFGYVGFLALLGITLHFFMVSAPLNRHKLKDR